MAWFHKEQPTSFDTSPIEGLYFLIGDALSKEVAGQKYPMLKFPSGLPCELWESSQPNNPIVHLFGEMDLLLFDSRDNAFTHAANIAEQVGYLVHKRGNQSLELVGHDRNEHLLVTYDPIIGRMADVQMIRNRSEMPRPPLLNEESRKRLPPLRSNEKLGLNALAQVKFLISNWTWYASEFDGADTFFGLVVGHEIELGYFSLSELSSLRGPLGLRVERDRHFAPTTLKELMEDHKRQRRG